MTASPETLTCDGALAAAMRRVHAPNTFDAAVTTDRDVQRYADNGWTVGAFEVIEMLTWWAVEHRTDLARGATRDGSRTQQEVAVARALIRDAEWWRCGGSLTDALRWCAVVAAAQDEDAATLVSNTLFVDLTGPNRQWFALGRLGPLAFVAGMKAEEAVAQKANLDAAGLRTLAVLRGWLLPDIEDYIDGLIGAESGGACRTGTARR